MRIALTGATGFLGRYLVREAQASGHECRGLIRPGSPHEADKPGIEWVVGRFGDDEAMRGLVAGAEVVVHAALDHPGGGFQRAGIDVAEFAERNIVATIRLIEASRVAGVGRVVVISSGAVHDVVLPDRPLDETHPLWPKSHYGAVKAAIEAFVASYGRGEGYPVAALRPTAIYGVAEPATASRWFDLVRAVVRGEDVDCRRAAKVVHAADVARAGLLLATTDRPIAGEVYHCVDRFTTDHEVATVARELAGTASAIDGQPPGNRNPITSGKLRALGFSFGGEPLLRSTIAELVARAQREAAGAT